MPIDDGRGHIFKFVRTPDRFAILVDDGGADTFDEIMLRDAGERKPVVLLETLLDLIE